jgi:nucleotide-binding universal stress UspA family protein
MKTLLVAHDFSPCADAALREALLEARLFRDAKIVVIHVLPPPPIAAVDVVTSSPALDSELQATLLAQSEAELQRTVALVAKDSPDISIESRVVAGLPAPTLLELAQSLKADRIIVGTHGRRGLEHFFLGSVAERVLRDAQVPVVVVRAAR